MYVRPILVFHVFAHNRTQFHLAGQTQLSDLRQEFVKGTNCNLVGPERCKQATAGASALQTKSLLEISAAFEPGVLHAYGQVLEAIA